MQLSTPKGKGKETKRSGFAKVMKPKASLDLNSEKRQSQNHTPGAGAIDVGDHVFQHRPNQTFMEWCNENEINYANIRKLNRQPVRDGDPGLVWDSFELPKEFAGQELPPLPPTPVSVEPQSSHFQMPSWKSNKSPVDKKETLCFMKDLIQRMQEDAESRKRDRQRMGLSSVTEDSAVDDGGSDLDSSFILDYTPSPIPTTERSKRFNLVKVEQTYGATPCKRSKTSSPSPQNQGNETEMSTPRNRRPSRQNSSLNTSADSESQLVRRTRLSFDEKVTVPLVQEDETVWSDGDDEVLSQINLNYIEPSVCGSDSSHTLLNDAMVHGEGFEDSDPDEDLIFSQLNF